MEANRLFRHVKTVFLSSQITPGIIRLGVFRGIRTMGVPAESVQIRLGLWERETYKYIRQAAKMARWMVDIGAGSGEHSLFFSSRTQAYPIIAVEPFPDLLRQNIELNHSRNIEILETYIGTKVGQVRLDSLLVPRQATGFIKLDTDGAEFDILKSGEGLLREARPLLLVETHSAALERDCSDFLASLGYEIVIVPNAWWRTIVPEQRPGDHNRWLWAKHR
jgi:Methyltransferase FkbM domain